MSVNKVILVGNVGDDPNVRYLDNNVAVANFSLATSERGYTLSNGTQVPERTEWHNIVVWRGLAETAEKFVKKGSQVYIEGKIQSRSWTDKDGNKRTSYEILADNMQLLGRKSDSATASNNTEAAAPAKKRNPKTEVPASESTGSVSPAPAGQEDDLPF